MSPLELADELEAYHTRSHHKEAAICLREQHRIILKLRETLELVLDDLPDYVYSLEPVLDVLQATKEYETSNSS